MPLVPFGAGSGVCGAVLPEEDSRVVDLKRLARIRAIDPDAPLVEVEAGHMGIDLENALEREGFTAGHFPSSILCSTVGGWVAARGAGQCSGYYGKIEDITAGLEARHRRGARRAPRAANVGRRSRLARHRQRGNDGHRDERRPAPAPQARGSSLRRLVLPDDAGRMGGHADPVPGRPPARGRPPLRSVRRAHRQARRATKERHAAIGSACAGTPRRPPAGDARPASPGQPGCSSRVSGRGPWAARCSWRSSRVPATRSRPRCARRARCSRTAGVPGGSASNPRATGSPTATRSATASRPSS